MHQIRKEAINRATSAQQIGIILGSLGRQGSPKILQVCNISLQLKSSVDKRILKIMFIAICKKKSQWKHLATQIREGLFVKLGWGSEYLWFCSAFNNKPEKYCFNIAVKHNWAGWVKKKLCLTLFFNHILLYMAVSFYSWRIKLFLEPSVSTSHGIRTWTTAERGDWAGVIHSTNTILLTFLIQWILKLRSIWLMSVCWSESWYRCRLYRTE